MEPAPGLPAIFPAHVKLKGQSHTPMVTTFSKRQLKSTWTTLPVLVSRRMFSQCLSPSLQSTVWCMFSMCSSFVPQNEANHRCDSCTPCIDETAGKPCRWLGKRFQEPLVEHRTKPASYCINYTPHTM